MPYRSNRELPQPIKDALPTGAQDIYRNVVNSVLADGGSDSKAAASAWAAVKRAGYEKDAQGKWSKVGKSSVGKSFADVVCEDWPSFDGSTCSCPDGYCQGEDLGVSAEVEKKCKKKKTVQAIAAKADAAGNVEKATYQGQTVSLNKPFRLPAGSSKKFGVYVSDGGSVKRVTFGDPNMEIRRDDAEARRNFRARHRCDEQNDKTTAGYWSCKLWEAGATVTELTKEAEMDDVITLRAEIQKANDEKRLVYAWASVVTKNGEPVADLQGDIITIDELEKAAHGFMLDSREAGEMHIRTTGIGKVVESVVLSKQLQEALGIDLGQEGWFIVMKITDSEVWERVKKGELSMLSIGGRGRRG